VFFFFMSLILCYKLKNKKIQNIKKNFLLIFCYELKNNLDI